jgi:hypothetical protein
MQSDFGLKSDRKFRESIGRPIELRKLREFFGVRKQGSCARQRIRRNRRDHQDQRKFTRDEDVARRLCCSRPPPLSTYLTTTYVTTVTLGDHPLQSRRHSPMILGPSVPGVGVAEVGMNRNAAFEAWPQPGLLRS